MLARRKSFGLSGKYTEACERICSVLRSLDEYRSAGSVMLYLPIGGEADVRHILTDNKSFYVPVTKGVIITPAQYGPGMKIKTGAYGVSEPEKPRLTDKGCIDFVVVPAVAVDRSKNRMGFGKGCYDRFLAGMKCTKAAVCFDFQVIQNLEQKPHDIKMDYIITESGYF